MKQLNEVRYNPLLQHLRRQIRITYPELLETASSVIASQVSSRHRAYERNDVPIIEGHAHFKDAHTLMVEHAGRRVAQIKAKNVVIATGSRPYHPEGLDFDHKRVHDSDSILKAASPPTAKATPNHVIQESVLQV